jgi:hypothetical protein
MKLNKKVFYIDYNSVEAYERQKLYKFIIAVVICVIIAIMTCVYIFIK